MTLVSIITVVKDDAVGLLTTYSTLKEQSFQGWEVIIVVGYSQDSTLSTAAKLQSQDQRLTVLEEKGRSVYGAMNEGLMVAKGEFVWFMNAGDRFASPDVLADAVREISTSSVGVVVGGYGVNTGEGERTYRNSVGNLNSVVFAFNRRGGCHQAMIFRTDSLKKSGSFDTSYSLASDFAAVLEIIKTTGARRVSKIYALVEPGGLADQGIATVHREKHLIRRKVFRNPIITMASVGWTCAAKSKIKLRKFQGVNTSDSS
jgi:putative colanic acid biosynthesis glycosyltransferase